MVFVERITILLPFYQAYYIFRLLTELPVKSPLLALITAILLTPFTTIAMANNSSSTQHKELKAEIKILKDARDPNIKKVYHKLHLVTSDAIITEQELQELKELIESNKKKLGLTK